MTAQQLPSNWRVSLFKNPSWCFAWDVLIAQRHDASCKILIGQVDKRRGLAVVGDPDAAYRALTMQRFGGFVDPIQQIDVKLRCFASYALWYDLGGSRGSMGHLLPRLPACQRRR